jgi:hypothetical protein
MQEINKAWKNERNKEGKKDDRKKVRRIK